MTAFLAALVAYKAILLPLLTGLIGWFFPSPFQKAVSAQVAVKAAEDAATATGDTSGLDKLP